MNRRTKTRVVQSFGDPGKWQAQYYDAKMKLWFDLGDATETREQAEEKERDLTRDPRVTTWADGHGVWHARVPANCVSPLIAARRALRDELTPRVANLAREVWQQPVRVADLDTAETIVYRERSLGSDR